MRSAFFTVLLLLTALVAASAQEITVAAASDLQFAMPELVQRFEKQTGAHVKVSYGSSGNFFSQIQNQAPFDVFFSADASYPQKLEAAGLTEPGTVRTYATGKIVLWVRNDSTLDLRKGLRALLDPRVKRIAIANPNHAPYGRAAVAALQSEGLYDRLKDRLVMGENISQTAQFIQTGNADIGVIALSLAIAPAMKAKGRYVEIPDGTYPAIQQACAVMKSSKEKATARKFVEYVTSAEGQKLLQQFGFGR
jgi:molybdate transport system substrate-binding protein